LQQHPPATWTTLSQSDEQTDEQTTDG